MRTTHYPYSEEFLSLCDELGIAVIGEAPAVGLQAVNMVPHRPTAPTAPPPPPPRRLHRPAVAPRHRPTAAHRATAHRPKRVRARACVQVRETLRQHLDVMGELITRDKNHACVVMWSVANEPDSEAPAAATYFKHLVAQTKALDPSRPVTFASFKSPDKDVAAPHVDVLMINKYHAWYTSTGQLDIIPPMLRRDLLQWRRRLRKPLLVSEYGADAPPP